MENAPVVSEQVELALKLTLCASLFLKMAKHIFTIYVVKVAKLGAVYGPLMFRLWIFYSSCVILIGAELVHNLCADDKSEPSGTLTQPDSQHSEKFHRYYFIFCFSD